MKKLNELYDTDYDVEIKDIKFNSMYIEPGDLFVCTNGVNFDRHDFIDDAIKKGAAALVVSKKGEYSIPYIEVADTNVELGEVSKRFYGYKDTIDLIGITGTDGKTTTTSLIRELLGIDKCGFIGTLGALGKKFRSSVPNTTPECIYIYKYLAQFEKEGLKYCAMETSSEGFLRNRLDPFTFTVGVHTNITGDHMNIHKTMENYIDCKAELFRKIKKEGYAILNKDDVHYKEMRDACSCNIYTYGKDKDCTLVIKTIKEYSDKTKATISLFNKEYNIISPLLGDYNVYNLAAAILTLVALGYKIENIIPNIKKIKTIEGRLDFLEFGQNYKIILDYAHTINSLKNTLEYLNKIKKKRIITITGSAGGRETSKRSAMGKTVQELSDLVIYTMDDPRFEDPELIIDDMIDKTKDNYLRIVDREMAIKKAFSIATKNDIIFIAGKGRDNYMAIGDKYVKYNDYDVVKKHFK